MNSNFFKRKVVSQENKIIKKFLNEFKSTQKNIEQANNLKYLKNINQSNLINILLHIRLFF